MRKKWVGIIFLLSLLGLGLVYAQESGYFLNLTNTNAEINTSINNSTVIENVTLSNGTLTLNINADNISSVTINGVNYTSNGAAPTQTSNEPRVIISYYGENKVPEGIVGFPGPWLDFWTNQSAPSFYYSWNLTVVNINPVNSFWVPIQRAFQPLVAKYPQVAIAYTDVPNQPYGSGNLTLRADTVGFNGRLDKQCMVLYSYSQLSGEQVNNLTQDIITQLTPAIIEWYS